MTEDNAEPPDEAVELTGVPAPPTRVEPSDWEHIELWNRVMEALRALPSYFETRTVIEGLPAPDIHTLNTVLGATIEDQVVASLNSMRAVWDPDKEYQAYGFVRQAQTFPDVLLQKTTNGREILMGIELKGWYLLAKEGVPNFRYLASADAVNPWDLIVVVPWALNNVLAGTPQVFNPFIEVARYAAQQRNHFWEHVRKAKEGSNRAVHLADGVTPYPKKSDSIQDRAASDSGGNFGRLARYGILSDYVPKLLETPICGLPASEWHGFFKQHARAKDS